MNTFIKKTTLLCVLAVGMFGCDDMLKTTPRQSVDPEVALGSPAGVRAVVNSVYNRLQRFNQYGNQMRVAPDILADVTVLQGNSGRYQAVWNNVLGAHIGIWTNNTASHYAAINEVNFVIEGVRSFAPSSLFPATEQNRILGEMFTIRALLYHDLAKVYGYEPGMEVNGWNLAVPIRTVPTRSATQAAAFSPRNTNVEVYSLIKADLRRAVDSLFVVGGQAATVPNGDRVKANRAFAAGLLARVFLYEAGSVGRNPSPASLDSALARATQARNLRPQALVTTAIAYENLYHTTGVGVGGAGAESIFELIINPVGESLGTNDSPSTLLLPNYTARGGNVGLTWFDYSPSPALRDSYNPSDIRFAGSIRQDDTRPAGFGAATGRWYSLKYPMAAGPQTDNIPMMRTAELILIQAEAAGRAQGVAAGVVFLNQLRVARNLDPVDAADFANVGEFVDEVLAERFRELAFEGHRFYDLKRHGRVAPGKPNLTSYEQAEGTGWFQVLAPIPNAIIENSRPGSGADPVVIQNPGY